MELELKGLLDIHVETVRFLCNVEGSVVVYICF
jgi:hypothetical protein